jgi:hypothetical protein
VSPQTLLRTVYLGINVKATSHATNNKKLSLAGGRVIENSATQSMK